MASSFFNVLNPFWSTLRQLRAKLRRFNERKAALRSWVSAHYPPYYVGAFPVLLWHGVGVHVPRYAGRRVAEPARHVHNVLAARDEHSRLRVPLRYNYDKPEKPRRIKGFEVFSLVFHPFPNRKITLK